MRFPRHVKYPQLLLAGTTALLVYAAAGGAQAACTYTYGTLSSTNPNLGNVVSGTTGETVWRVPATSSGGLVQQPGGAGTRQSSGGAVISITIQTNNNNDCNSSTISGTISASGTPTGRAKAMRNFDVAGGSGVTISNEAGSSPRTFTIAALGKNVTRTIYIGMDFPIKGDNEGGATGGTSSSAFSVALNASNGNDVTRTGAGVATVRRSIRLTKSSDLSFGRVVRPSSGSNTVGVNATTGLPSITGAGNAVHVPPASVTRAAYTVQGEGGQTFSLTVPSSMTMSGPGGNLTVTLTKFPNTTSGALDGSLNQDGDYEFWVGGSFPITSSTTSGTYTGAFNVSVAYN
jgi:hypothetical protein